MSKTGEKKTVISAKAHVRQIIENSHFRAVSIAAVAALRVLLLLCM